MANAAEINQWSIVVMTKETVTTIEKTTGKLKNLLLFVTVALHNLSA